LRCILCQNARNVIHIKQLQHVGYHIYDHFVHSEAVKFVQASFLALCVWGDVRINCKYFPTRFDVLLTVHLSIILATDELNAQILVP
jgi:hypothetical protein